MTNATTSPEAKSKSAITSASRDVTTELDRSQALATALYDLGRNHTFYCGLLQSMSITYSHMLPTAGITFSTDLKRYELYLNPMFFCKALNEKQRIAVLRHELEHLVRSHLTRVPFMKVSNHNRKLLNIAGDLSINSVIPDIPKGCSQCPPIEEQKLGATCKNELCCGRGMFPEDFHDEDEKGNKTVWQAGLSMEQYFLKLKDLYKEPEDGEDGDDSGEGDGEGEEGNGKPKKGKGGGTPREFDSHDWEANGEEKEMLEAMEDLVKRAMVKTSTSYDNLPSHIQKLMEDIKSRKAELNYKALILSAIKRSASGTDRRSTWTRKNRRFGLIAPGTKEGDLPKLRIVLDTSGSISIEQLNEFLGIVDQFLRVGSRKCSLHLFSDTEYYSQPYKMGDRVGQGMLRKNVKMGGTCLENSLENILKKRPDLSLILTDGYYSDIDESRWLKPGQRFPQTVFIIEKQGTAEHPFANREWSTTVKVPAK